METIKETIQMIVDVEIEYSGRGRSRQDSIDAAKKLYVNTLGSGTSGMYSAKSLSVRVLKPAITENLKA